MQSNRGKRLIYIIVGVVCLLLLVEVALYLNYRFHLLNIGGSDFVEETVLAPTQSVDRSESEALSRETVVPDDLRGKMVAGRIISVSEKNEFVLEIVDTEGNKRTVNVWPRVVVCEAKTSSMKVGSFRDLVGRISLELEFTENGDLIIFY